MKKLESAQSSVAAKPVLNQHLLGDIRNLIDSARERAAQTVNANLVTLYWNVGNRIRREILKEKRAGYGEKIIPALSAQLAPEYGNGFNPRNLFHMIHFTEVFPNLEIVYALSSQLGWTHFRSIIPLKDPLQREFYAEMCRLERWSTRTLGRKIQLMLFERTGLSRRPAELARQELKALREKDKMTPDLVFRDPYILDFLGLKDTYSEKDLETAILRELERFILELGAGFTFVARQKRITVGNDDFYLDLLFYHRKLRRLVAIDLKLGKFQPADKGQMELYLRWLEKNDMESGDGIPLGLILCAGKSSEQVELLELEQSGIRVAEYLTELPPRELLKKKLHQAIQSAREQLNRKKQFIALDQGGNLKKSATFKKGTL